MAESLTMVGRAYGTFISSSVGQIVALSRRSGCYMEAIQVPPQSGQVHVFRTCPVAGRGAGRVVDWCLPP
jgi:hypothetical protein